MLVATEIESPHSATTDRVAEPVDYAHAGIPHFWRLETDPMRLLIYRLADDACSIAVSREAHETAHITDPLDVDLSAPLLG